MQISKYLAAIIAYEVENTAALDDTIYLQNYNPEVIHEVSPVMLSEDVTMQANQVG